MLSAGWFQYTLPQVVRAYPRLSSFYSAAPCYLRLRANPVAATALQYNAKKKHRGHRRDAKNLYEVHDARINTAVAQGTTKTINIHICFFVPVFVGLVLVLGVYLAIII